MDLRPADDPTRLLALAEERFTAARATPHRFRRDALYDEVTDAMVRATSATLWAFCNSHAPGDPSRAEDILQSTYLVFRDNLPLFEGRSSLKTWLYGIALNRCRDQSRLDARRQELLAEHGPMLAESLHAALPSPDEALDRLERERAAAALERAIARLAPNERYLVRARLVDELDYASILEVYRRQFGEHITTVEGLRTLFFHARRRLIADLRGEGVGDPGKEAR